MVNLCRPQRWVSPGDGRPSLLMAHGGGGAGIDAAP
jgi:hypothetical protein